MIFHLNFLEGQGVYNLHHDVLQFFENAVNEVVFSDNLFPAHLGNVVHDSNELQAKFINVFNELNAAVINKQLVFQILSTSNAVIDILGDPLYPIATFPSPDYNQLKQRIKDLYLFLWGSTLRTLTCINNYGSLKEHYRLIDSLNLERTRRICPFCGLRKLENPKEKRNEYDHYFDKATYPHMAINFENLVPMCDSCNKAPNKGTKQMVLSAGHRRPAYYPYHEVDTFSINTTCSNLFLPNETWTVTTASAIPDRGFIAWKEVFRIDIRYANYVVDDYKFWLYNFGNHYIGHLPTEVEELKEKVTAYVDNFLNPLTIEPGLFLQIDFWSNFIVNTDDGDLELIISFLIDREQFLQQQ